MNKQRDAITTPHNTNAVMPIILRMVVAFFILELYLGGLRAFYHKAFGLDFVVFSSILGVKDDFVLAGLEQEAFAGGAWVEVGGELDVAVVELEDGTGGDALGLAQNKHAGYGHREFCGGVAAHLHIAEHGDGPRLHFHIVTACEVLGLKCV